MKLVRKYPIGIQSFDSVRRDGYIYVDKTPLIFKMITEGKSYFLSRPRRFGKSLLCSTLAAIFEGRRDLFDVKTVARSVERELSFVAVDSVVNLKVVRRLFPRNRERNSVRAVLVFGPFHP